jgi:hypothetical protein
MREVVDGAVARRMEWDDWCEWILLGDLAEPAYLRRVLSWKRFFMLTRESTGTTASWPGATGDPGRKSWCRSRSLPLINGAAPVAQRQ